jgi:hypothetical protein
MDVIPKGSALASRVLCSLRRRHKLRTYLDNL